MRRLEADQIDQGPVGRGGDAVALAEPYHGTVHESDLGFSALADVLQVLGMSCGRLARLVNTELSLHDKRADELGEALAQSLAAVLDELNQSGLAANGNGDSDG